MSIFFVITDNVGVAETEFAVTFVEGSNRIDLSTDGQLAAELGFRTGRVRDNVSLVPDKNDTKSISKVYGWFGGDIDHWEDNLYAVTLGNLTGERASTEFSIVVQVSSSDKADNSEERTFTFRVDNG
jgi:hypothetical protein